MNPHVNDENTTGNSTGNPKTTPGTGLPPVVPPPPARPPTSSLPVQPPAGTDDPAPSETPSRRREPSNDTPSTETPAAVSKETLLKAGIVVAGLVLLGLLIWWVATLLGSGNQQANNPAPGHGVGVPVRAGNPGRAAPGWGGRPGLPAGRLLRELRSRSHGVPRGGLHHRPLRAAGRRAPVPGVDSYPGVAALREKGREICQGAGLTDAVANYVLSNATPTRATPAGNRATGGWTATSRRTRATSSWNPCIP